MRFLLLLLTTWCGTAVALDTVFAPTPQHTLTPPGGAKPADSFFGQSVAMSEFYAVVGDSKQRRVHIYKKSATGSWNRIQEINYLTNPPVGTGSYDDSVTPTSMFGNCVQITDNFLLVGAYGAQRAFLFERTSTTFQLVQQFQPTNLDSVRAQAGHTNKYDHCASSLRKASYCGGFGEILALTDEWVVSVPPSTYGSGTGRSLSLVIGALVYRRNDDGSWPVEATQIIGSDMYQDKQRNCKSVAISPESTWLAIGCPYGKGVGSIVKPQVYLYERLPSSPKQWTLKSRFSDVATTQFGYAIGITENWMIVEGSKHWIYSQNQGSWILDYAGANSNSYSPAVTDDLWVEVFGGINRVYKRTREMAAGMATWGYACSNIYEGNTNTGCPMHHIYRPGETSGATSWNQGKNARALSPNGNYLILGDMEKSKAYIYSQNKCTCSNGNPRKGFSCPVNGADNCVECSCANGIAKDSSTCIVDGEHCVSCAAGYGSDTDDSCSASCAAGKYNVGGNDNSCTMCPSGRYSLSLKGTAASSCNLVVEGVTVDSSWSSTHIKVAWKAIIADHPVDRYEIEATAAADQQSSWESVKAGLQSEVTVDGTQQNSVLVLKAYVENVVGWTSGASMSFRIRFRHGQTLGWGAFGPGGVSPRGCTGNTLTKALGPGACVATCPIGREELVVGGECFSNVCPAGKFGTVAPVLDTCTACAENTFSETGDSAACLSCPSGFLQAKLGSSHCCPVVEGGLCSECSSKDSCDVSVDCDINFFDVDGVVANGCEVGCPVVTNATCDACSNENTCTAVTCDVNTFDSDGETTNGCEAGCPEISGGVCDTCSDNNTCTAFICEVGKTSLQGAICSVYPNELEECSTTLEVLEKEHNTFNATNIELTVEKKTLTSERDILTEEKGELITERGELVADKTNLLGEKVVLETERDTLNTTNIELMVEKKTLTSERDTLTEEKGELITEKNSLARERDDLQNDKKTLTTQNDALVIERNTLQSDKTMLELAVDTLQSDKTMLELAVDLANKTAATKQLELNKANADLLVEKQIILEHQNNTPEKKTDSDSNTDEADIADIAAPSPSAKTVIDSTCDCKHSDSDKMSAPNLSLYLMAATVGMIITLSIIFFWFCCCRKKSTNPIPNLAVVPIKKGKLRSFVDQNHDKITKVAHHDHAKSVQKMSRAHSKAKVKIIQKKQDNAKSRLQTRLQMRANMNNNNATKKKKKVRVTKVEIVELDKKETKKHKKKLAKEERKAKKKALKAQLLLERRHVQEKDPVITEKKEMKLVTRTTSVI